MMTMLPTPLADICEKTIYKSYASTDEAGQIYVVNADDSYLSFFYKKMENGRVEIYMAWRFQSNFTDMFTFALKHLKPKQVSALEVVHLIQTYRNAFCI